MSLSPMSFANRSILPNLGRDRYASHVVYQRSAAYRHHVRTGETEALRRGGGQLGDQADLPQRSRTTDRLVSP